LYLDQELKGSDRELVIYGEDLIANTSYYIGPKGIVAPLTNGMNCQNCHLDAGSRPWGNNYGGVYSTYPKYRDRSGAVESIYKRVADCMERSLGGVAVDSNSREFKAIYAYMKWLGHQVPKGKKPYGSGIEKLPFLTRAADPEKGRGVYIAKCQSCHQADGQGQWNEKTNAYVYPPLWGPHSYTDAAGLYRISNFAGYVRNNMPWNQSSHQNPSLSVEDCWDVAAFVNSRPRPHKNQSADWPNRAKKPIDFPFGPYADGFSESQHKYGPYAGIVAAMKK
jgi:thiosulfate dehydrogenase